MATSNHSIPPTPKGLEASKVMRVCVIGQVNVYPSGGGGYSWRVFLWMVYHVRRASSREVLTHRQVGILSKTAAALPPDQQQLGSKFLTELFCCFSIESMTKAHVMSVVWLRTCWVCVRGKSSALLYCFN